MPWPGAAIPAHYAHPSGERADRVAPLRISEDMLVTGSDRGETSAGVPRGYFPSSRSK